MKLYFKSHSKRYKAIEVEDKRYEFMINFAYRKKINMNIEEAKKLAELITSTYYVHSIIEKKITILKSLEDKDHFFKDEMLILNEIFEDLKNELKYSLVLKPANSEEEIYFFKNISKKELLKDK